MACLTCLLFSMAYYGVLFGYSGYQVVLTIKENKIDKMWVLYFLMLGVLTLLEGSVLFPIKYIMGLISCKLWMILKLLFCLWLYHPTYRGALLLEQIGGKHIDMAYNVSWGVTKSILTILGVPDREAVSETKKTQ